MFVIYNEKTNKPIKVWLESAGQIEESCLEQAYHLSNLPFIHKWACLMPDTHTGKGMPIGGVIAAEGVIIPNAVGVDIGCGMNFVSIDIKVEEMRGIMTGNGTLIQSIVGDILRNIPVGFNSYKTKQESQVLNRAMENREIYEKNPHLFPLIEDAYYQVGTLGGGNHFIELQEDQDGFLGIMIHSGSRHFGKEICDEYHNRARALNTMWHSKVPDEYRLAFLPVESEEGREYIDWMNLALEYAFENRERMTKKVIAITSAQIEKHMGLKMNCGKEINCHHNYAALENHYDKNVWVHRKGATRARNGELAVIPGAMGSYSYVVMGKGNPESFCSSSHGAGRAYSRKGAMAAFSCEQVMTDLKQQGVVLGKYNKSDVAEESRFAYKDIESVMDSQTDLVVPIKRLKTVGVIKG
ncbi:RNA-splicing ligase RtcB [Clostridium sp. chh4-2]|uniref:RtcB family protein n=1 Tax=Clostridium sp. chh4-2 TaxID=2067550 RepID=UPI000CCED634|nr:RtcB family protein [Clostridium sp. chh4-2]PNV59942.1 RNA-splicing ligase RtcB [Clostridium sp. chh4-2]